MSHGDKCKRLFKLRRDAIKTCFLNASLFLSYCVVPILFHRFTSCLQFLFRQNCIWLTWFGTPSNFVQEERGKNGQIVEKPQLNSQSDHGGRNMYCVLGWADFTGFFILILDNLKRQLNEVLINVHTNKCNIFVPHFSK